ncbi:uncharacterized protein [Solanum lycopersicum]|uniref:uncharacterized protein n=1 Tax=Solanum lycopersicum TaxID=4081 RepID=UPI003749CA68
MSVGFPIDVVDIDDASGTRENQAAQEEPNVSTRATQSPFTSQAEPNESTGAAQSSFTATKGETHQSQKKGNCFKASSSKVNEKGRCKKRKTVEDDNETVLKGLMEVMKQFTESHDKRMASLIDKLGERDLSEIRDYSTVGVITKIQSEVQSTQMLFCQVLLRLLFMCLSLKDNVTKIGDFFWGKM